MPKMSFSGESGNPGYRSKPHVTDSGESDTWRDTEEREREEKRGRERGDVGNQRNGKSEEKPEVQNGRYQGCRQRVWGKGEENPLKLLTSKGSHGADDGSRTLRPLLEPCPTAIKSLKFQPFTLIGKGLDHVVFLKVLPQCYLRALAISRPTASETMSKSLSKRSA